MRNKTWIMSKSYFKENAIKMKKRLRWRKDYYLYSHYILTNVTMQTFHYVTIITSDMYHLYFKWMLKNLVDSNTKSLSKFLFVFRFDPFYFQMNRTMRRTDRCVADWFVTAFLCHFKNLKSIYCKTWFPVTTWNEETSW